MNPALVIAAVFALMFLAGAFVILAQCAPKLPIAPRGGECLFGLHAWDYDPEGKGIADCACLRCGKKGKWNPYMWT